MLVWPSVDHYGKPPRHSIAEGEERNDHFPTRVGWWRFGRMASFEVYVIAAAPKTVSQTENRVADRKPPQVDELPQDYGLSQDYGLPTGLWAPTG